MDFILRKKNEIYYCSLNSKSLFSPVWYLQLEKYLSFGRKDFTTKHNPNRINLKTIGLTCTE